MSSNEAICFVMFQYDLEIMFRTFQNKSCIRSLSENGNEDYLTPMRYILSITERYMSYEIARKSSVLIFGFTRKSSVPIFV